MRLDLLIARRHLMSSPGQTILLIFGVALGVMVFVFITALINGLRDNLLNETTGSVAHVILEPRDLTPVPRRFPDDTRLHLPVSLPSRDRRAVIRDWREALKAAEVGGSVTAAVPLVAGNGFLLRGQAAAPVLIQGVEPSQLSAITGIGERIVAGVAELDLRGVVLGVTLANDLGLRVGQPVTLRSDRERESSLVVRGIYRTGVGSLDERVVYLNQRAARGLLDLPDGVTSLEIRLAAPLQASAKARSLGDATGLVARDWIERNERLFAAIAAQGNSARIIQSFSLVTIVVGVASALLLATYRRRGEVAVMAAMGLGRGFIARVFLIQGALIGSFGALVGSVAGYGLCLLLTIVARNPDGTLGLPIDPAQGGYVSVTALTILGAIVAAALPARSATKTDPIEVLNG